MLKKRRILLFLICVFIIGGIIFNAVYIRRKHEESIQDINIKKELGTDLLVDVKPWTKIDIHKWNSIFPKIMALKIIDLPVKKINCKTVVKHSSGIDYQKSELENKSTKKGQGIKIEIPAKKQDPAQISNATRIWQQPIETTSTEHESENAIQIVKKKVKRIIKVSKHKNREDNNEQRNDKINVEPRITKNRLKHEKVMNKIYLRSSIKAMH